MRKTVSVPSLFKAERCYVGARLVPDTVLPGTSARESVLSARCGSLAVAVAGFSSRRSNFSLVCAVAVPCRPAGLLDPAAAAWVRQVVSALSLPASAARL
jgi:hypothetical protein